MRITPFQPKPSLVKNLTPVIDFLEQKIEPGLKSIKDELDKVKVEKGKLDKAFESAGKAIKKFNKKWFVGNLATRTKVIMRGYRKELQSLISAFEKRLPMTTGVLSGIGKFAKGGLNLAKKVGSAIWDLAGKGWMSFVIDLLTFKALQWLADKNNQKKIKSIFDGMFKLFNLAVNIGKFTISVGKAVWWGLRKIGDLTRFLWEATKWITGYKLGEWTFEQLEKIKWDEIGKNLKGMLDSFGEFISLKPAAAVAGTIPSDKELESLTELQQVFDKDIPNALKEGNEGAKEDIDNAKTFLGKEISDKDIEEADKGIEEINNTFNLVGKDTEKSSESAIIAPGSPVESIKSSESAIIAPGSPVESIKSSEMSEADKKALEGALTGKSKNNIKPLPPGKAKRGSSVVKSQSKDKETGNKLNKLFQLPFKAVGTAIVGMIFDSVSAIPGIGPMVKPLVSIIAGNFGLSSNSLMKFMSGTAMSEGNKFGDTMKLLVKFVEAVASGNILGFSGMGDDSKSPKKIENKTGFSPEELSGDEKVQSIIKTANELGVTPMELAAVIALESGFNPKADNGTHQGLWQAGSSERAWAIKELGLPSNTNWKDVPFDKQMEALVPWLKSRKFKPGEMGQADLYSTILTGSPGNYNRKDANNTSVATAGITKGGRKWEEAAQWMRQNGYTGGMMRGGLVTGSQKTGDNVDAVLEPGEYVLNKNAVKTFESLFGKNSLDSLNYNIANRFGESPQKVKSLKDMAMDMRPNQKYRLDTNKSKAKTNVINIPEKVNNYTNNFKETYGEAPLGETIDMSLYPFSSMVGAYV